MRLAKDELGLDISAEITPSLLGVFDDLVGDPRGHVIDIVYGFTIDDTSQIKTTDQTSEIGFFDKLPQDMGFSHRQSLIGLGFKTD
jgi:ADP-ribose pyrophosphatase YjhB (NUDIX family)